MDVLLIRHGEVQNDKGIVYDESIKLSPLGFQQLRDLGVELQNRNLMPDALFVSPYFRAQQSADEVLRASPHVPRFTLNDLRDVDPNSWVGQSIEDYQNIFGDVYSHPIPGLPHESLDQVGRRMHGSLLQAHRIALRNGYNRIGIVSHGDPLSSLHYMLFHGKPPLDYLKMKEKFYPRKGDAVLLNVDHELRPTKKRRVIRVESVKRGVEWN